MQTRTPSHISSPSALPVAPPAMIRLPTPRRSPSQRRRFGIRPEPGSAVVGTTALPPPRPPPDASDFPPWSYDPRPFFRFEVVAESSISDARVGRIHTPHGIVDTPGFVPVATNGALKGVDFRSLDETSMDASQLVFCNAYHLMLHPGADAVGEAGGIHAFTGRGDGGPFMSDSGGLQVFSLKYGSVEAERSHGGVGGGGGGGGKGKEGGKGELKRSGPRRRRRRASEEEGMDDVDVMGEDAVRVTEEGVTFRSYRDGSELLLTPEGTVRAQKRIGADIIVPLDELPPHHIDRDRLAESVDRSHRWEARSLLEHLRDVNRQAMYAVVHGGTDVELRARSVEYLTSLPFDGYAIGGSLGGSRSELRDLLRWLMPMFRDSDERVRPKPRHLLGIGDEESVRFGVLRGVDTMDSCYPTRLGRHGTLLTRGGTIKMRKERHARSYGEKIDEGCGCRTCEHYDRAYLCHLYRCDEPLAAALGTEHNLRYMADLMAGIRRDILDGKL